MQLFDTDNVLNKQALDYIFTTEGHVIRLDPAYRIKPWDQTTPTHLQPEKVGGALLKTSNDSILIEHSVSEQRARFRKKIYFPRLFSIVVCISRKQSPLWPTIATGTAGQH